MNTHTNTMSHEENIREIWALFRETREQFRKTDEKFDKVVRENDRRYQESVKQFHKTAKQFRETDKKIDKLAGRFDTQWGKLVESLAEDGVLKLFKQRGIKVREVYSRVKSERHGRHAEIDLLLVNDAEIVVIEVKTTLKADHVKDFLDRMDEFNIFFPHWKGLKTYGAVAALRMEQASERYAAKQGLFVIKVGGEGLVTLLNDDAFMAHDFGSACK